jgi:hypothetical protein
MMNLTTFGNLWDAGFGQADSTEKELTTGHLCFGEESKYLVQANLVRSPGRRL